MPAEGDPGHLLILGGTTEARRLAEALERTPLRVTTSLAGRVGAPVLPPGGTRIGGFGGVEGLAAWMTAHRVTHLVDATHPFAERMSFHAARARSSPAYRCSRCAVPAGSRGPATTGRSSNPSTRRQPCSRSGAAGCS